MNYLAHSLLSFSDGQLVGNMIADYIKNRDRASFPEEIQNGIALHRAIDSFTDSHPEISKAKKVFQPLVRLYAGAFVDVSLDYFVAHSLRENELKLHAEKTYDVLWKHEQYLPENFKKVLYHMEKDNWLLNYRKDWGIQFSLKNVVRKAKYLDDSIDVFPLFLEDKTKLKTHYDIFFPELFTFAQTYVLKK